MGFNYTELTGDQFLIEGTDNRGTSGSLVVDGSEWNALKQQNELASAHERFDAKVEDFFAEIIDAVDELEQAHKVTIDPLLYIVEQEEVVGTAPQREVLRTLQHGTVLLRAIESGKTDRFLWVNGDIVLAKAPITPAGTVEADTNADAVKAETEGQAADADDATEAFPQPGYATETEAPKGDGFGAAGPAGV